jgi:hypothetical protein
LDGYAVDCLRHIHDTGMVMTLTVFGPYRQTKYWPIQTNKICTLFWLTSYKCILVIEKLVKVARADEHIKLVTYVHTNGSYPEFPCAEDLVMCFHAFINSRNYTAVKLLQKVTVNFNFNGCTFFLYTLPCIFWQCLSHDDDYPPFLGGIKFSLSNADN